MSNLDPIHEVFSNRFLSVHVLDLNLEDFHINSALGFIEVRLKNVFTHLSHFELVICMRFRNDTTWFDLGSEHGVHVAEELENILLI